MKRLISLILAVLTIVLMFPAVTAYAAQDEVLEEIIWLDNDSYIKVTTQTISTYASGTVTKSKSYTCYTGDDAQWEITLNGTFTYNGVTSTCTSSSCDVSIYNSTNWYVVSKSANKSGNTATATATIGYRVLGITTRKDTYDLTLTCDKNGNVS